MTVAFVINQIVCAAAALGVVLASHHGAIVSASHSRLSSGESIEVEAPAAQTVNRAAKGDKWTSPSQADPEKATTPGGPRNPVIIAGQYEVVAATLTGDELSISDPLFTLRILPVFPASAADNRT